MINLCSNGHDEIVYEGSQCPLCDMRSDSQAEIDGLSNEIEELKNSIAERDGQISQLQEELAAAEIEVRDAEREIDRLRAEAQYQ